MSEYKQDDGSKKVKNIAAVLYVVVMIFLVGGSYFNSRHDDVDTVNATGEKLLQNSQ